MYVYLSNITNSPYILHAAFIWWPKATRKATAFCVPLHIKFYVSYSPSLLFIDSIWNSKDSSHAVLRRGGMLQRLSLTVSHDSTRFCRRLFVATFLPFRRNCPMCQQLRQSCQKECKRRINYLFVRIAEQLSWKWNWRTIVGSQKHWRMPSSC